MEGESGLKCVINLDVVAPTDKTAAKWTGDALRRIAAMIEQDGCAEGRHPVTDGSGKQIGEFYFDFFEVNPS